MAPPKDVSEIADSSQHASGVLERGEALNRDDLERATPGRDEELPGRPLPPDESLRGRRKAERVADIELNGFDACGEKITKVFHKRNNYAIYAVSNHVMTHFADDEEMAEKQIAEIAPLFSLRDRLEYLKQDLRCRGDYQLQVANAFRIGLQGNTKAAEEILGAAIHNATEKRARKGRLVYLGAACMLTAILAAVLCSLGGTLMSGAGDPSLGLLVLASGGGALGAFLSIAMAIRTRTVAPDGHFLTNAADGSLRILIGVLTGAALLLLLTSGFIVNPFAGTHGEALEIAWQAALIFGFTAGFLERLVPDLLEKREPLIETPAEKARTTEPG